MDSFLWNETAQYYNAYTNMGLDYEKFVNATQLKLCGTSNEAASPLADSKGDARKEEDPGGRECVDGNPATPGAIMTDSFYSQVGNIVVSRDGDWFIYAIPNTTRLLTSNPSTSRSVPWFTFMYRVKRKFASLYLGKSVKYGKPCPAIETSFKSSHSIFKQGAMYLHAMCIGCELLLYAVFYLQNDVYA